jgi:DNA methylase
MSAASARKKKRSKAARRAGPAGNAGSRSNARGPREAGGDLGRAGTATRSGERTRGAHAGRAGEGGERPRAPRPGRPPATPAAAGQGGPRRPAPGGAARPGTRAPAARRPRPEAHGDADYDRELDEWSTQRAPERAHLARRSPRPRELEPDEPGPALGGSRRPLSHTGGKVESLSGPSELTRAIERALSIDPERGVRDHIHGFHSYPARLHPLTAAGLIESLVPGRGTVADPFCGCGTVLVEARRLGKKAIGVDLNPLAVRLSRFKTHPLDAEERAALLRAAAQVVEHAEERRLVSAGPTHRYGAAEREAFDIHVLLELDGLGHGIKQQPAGFLRQALYLALSSIFSKVARDSGAEGASKRLASGFTIRFFESRVGELTRQLAAYEALLPPSAPGVIVREADARALGTLGLRNVDLFVSSPPYPGVLDYAEYHRTRTSWLGLDTQDFERLEMGARRHLQRLDHDRAAATWEADFTKVLVAMRSALAEGGSIALVVADSLLAGRPYAADVVVERCARRAGLSVVARGSQQRPHFHRQSSRAFADRPRYEHLLLLRP